MNNKFLYILLLVFSCCISACSQVLLKKASLRGYKTFLRQYLNPFVIVGYGLFIFVLIINIFIMRQLPIAICSVFCESLPLVFSFITGKLFFNEKISKEKIIGCCVILIGIAVIIL